MMRSLGRSLGCGRLAAITVLAIGLGAAVHAQDVAVPAAEVRQPPPPGDVQPPDAAAKAPAAGDAEDSKTPAEPIDPSQFGIAVRAVLESDPQTPVQLVRAAGILIDLGEPALAKPYISKLHATELDDATLAEVVQRLGSGPLLKIASEKTLEPEGREFGERAIAAAGRHARDPGRLAELVEQLGDPSPGAQRRAVAELLNAHEFAVPPLVTALNDPAKRATHARARDVLAALGSDAVAPLLATLDGPDSAAKLAAIEALGRMGAGEATPHLVGVYASAATKPAFRAAAENALLSFYTTTPSLREAARFLEAETREVFSGQRLLRVDPDGNVVIWVWDEAKAQPVAANVSAAQARSRLAARLAQRLLALAPDDPQHRTLQLVSMLEAEAYRVGLDGPLPREAGSAFARAVSMGASAVEDALSYAMEHGHAPAATVAAQVLGEIGNTGSLVRGGAELSPLVKALTHGNARLRFAAAQAIVRLQPNAPFAGLSHLKSSLVYFATSAGERKALVGFPNVETAQMLAGMVNSLGLSTATATNGRDVMRAATAAGGHELILVSSRIDRAPWYLVLEDLRQHAHTRQTPIIVLAEDDEVGVLRQRLRDDPLTSVALRPRSMEGMQYAVDQALRRAGDRIVPAAVREHQAQVALRSIGELMAAAPKVFDFRDYERQLAPLLYVPTLSPLAASVLAQFGTHVSQQSLLQIANRTSQPLASRQAAAVAFGDSVRRFGVRLTKGEILAQYDRYNQSEYEDAASQAMLGAVLDAIELPTKAAAKRELQGE